jgi:hypothetical protein
LNSQTNLKNIDNLCVFKQFSTRDVFCNVPLRHPLQESGFGTHNLYPKMGVLRHFVIFNIPLYTVIYSVLHIHCQPFLSILLRKTHYKVNVFPLTRRSNAGDLILQNASEITASRIFLKQQHFASNYCMFHQILLLAPTPRKRRFNACMTLRNSAKRQNEILYFKDFLRFLYTDDFTIICV